MSENLCIYCHDWSFNLDDYLCCPSPDCKERLHEDMDQHICGAEESYMDVIGKKYENSDMVELRKRIFELEHKQYVDGGKYNATEEAYKILDKDRREAWEELDKVHAVLKKHIKCACLCILDYGGPRRCELCRDLDTLKDPSRMGELWRDKE